MQAEDPLSRRPDHEEGVHLDNRDQILLKPEFFAIQAIEAAHESPINDDQILREVKEALLSDEVTKDYKSLLKSGPREFKKSFTRARQGKANPGGALGCNHNISHAIAYCLHGAFGFSDGRFTSPLV